MADNTTTPIADGTAIATDEIAGAHYQRVKVTFGVEGSAADASATNPLPVTFEEIGEVQATPTANTVLGRLKAIADAVTALSGNVDGLEALATTLNGYVDTLETLQGTTNTTLAALSGYMDGLETLQGTTNTSLTALQGFVDGLETLLADNLTTAAYQARQPTTGAKAASGSVPMVLSNDQDPVFDHANGAKFTVTTASQTAITPPAGARYLRVHATADMFIRTDGGVAADAAVSIILKAGVTETIPCVGGTAVTAIVATGTATLYATPSKSRT